MKSRFQVAFDGVEDARQANEGLDLLEAKANAFNWLMASNLKLLLNQKSDNFLRIAEILAEWPENMPGDEGVEEALDLLHSIRIVLSLLDFNDWQQLDDIVDRLNYEEVQ